MCWLQAEIAASSLSHQPSNMVLVELAKEVSNSSGLRIWVSAFIGMNTRYTRPSADVQGHLMWWSASQQSFQSSLTADSPFQANTKPRQILVQISTVGLSTCETICRLWGHHETQVSWAPLKSTTGELRNSSPSTTNLLIKKWVG